MGSRRCSRTACTHGAVATLTYNYADQTAVLGPLATYAEPHAYDLCAPHSERLSAPRGWQVLRLGPDPASLGPTDDDLVALADLVRDAGRRRDGGPDRPPAPDGSAVGTTVPSGPPGQRGHLRVLRPTE